MNQRNRILTTLYSLNTSVTPMRISLACGIPSPTVRKHLALWLSLGVVMVEDTGNSNKPKYYTTKELLTNFEEKQTRKHKIITDQLQCLEGILKKVEY